MRSTLKQNENIPGVAQQPEKIKTFLKVLLALLFSASIVILISSQFEEIWRFSKFLRLVILGSMVGLVAVGYYGVLELYVSSLLRKYSLAALLLLGVFIGLTGYYWTASIRGNLQTWIPISWLGGIGFLLERPAEWIVFFMAIPIFLSALVLAPIRGFENIKVESIVSISLFNPSGIFFVAFLGISLLPLLNQPNFKDFDNTYYGRVDLIRLFSRTRSHLGDQLINDAILTPDRKFLNGNYNNLNDFQNTWPFTQRELERIYSKLTKIEMRLTRKDIPLIIIIPPNKNTIYPELMPKEIPVIGEESRLDQVIHYLEERDGPYIIDMRERFFLEKQEHKLYYNTDSHWTPYGAYLGYEAIIMEINKYIPEVTPKPFEAFKLEKRQAGGNLSKSLANLDISEDFYRIVPVEGEKAPERVFLKRGEDRDYINILVNSDSSLPRLLVFRDSFCNDLIPYLTQNFSHSVFVLNDVDEFLFESETPQVVIIEYAERFLDRLLRIP